MLAEAYRHLRSHKPDQARDLLSALTSSQPDLVSAWHMLGEAEHRCGRPAAAEAAFRKVIALEPQNRRVPLALGAVLKECGRSAEAETVLGHGLAEAPESRLKAAYAYSLAFAQYDQG